MSLTSQQEATLKAAIEAETDPIVANAIVAQNYPAIRDFYNTDSANYVWKSYTNTSDISDVVIWKRMTSEAVPDATVEFTNRALQAIAQGRVLDILLRGAQVNTARSNIRQGIKDALTNLPTRPTENNGSWSWAAGSTPAIDAMKRLSTKAENLLASGAGTFADPSDLTFEGILTFQQVQKVLTQ